MYDFAVESIAVVFLFLVFWAGALIPIWTLRTILNLIRNIKKQKTKIKEASPKTFAPKYGLVHITRQQLEGTFIDSLETRLDLSKGKGQRLIPVGSGLANFAKLLNDSLDALEELAKDDNELRIYLQYLLSKQENRAPPLVIKVSSLLPVNAVRYYNAQTGVVEIILNEKFIRSLLDNYDIYDVVKYILS